MIHRIVIFDGYDPIGFEHFTSRREAKARIEDVSRFGCRGKYIDAVPAPKTDRELCEMLNRWGGHPDLG